MTRTLPAAQQQLLSASRQHRNLALLFDYDGTLTPIVEHPSLARLDPRTAEHLTRLSRLPRVFVGILSGRTIVELEQLVGLPNLYYAGTSGLELNLLGTRVIHSQTEKGRSLVEAARPVLENVAARHPGSWVEVKPLGLTLHYRAVRSEEWEAVRSAGLDALASFGEQLRILNGPLSLEITAALGSTKGTAVRQIVGHIGADVFPLYAGDEANDADALEMVNSLGGISVGVGPRAPAAARHYVPAPPALTEFLAELIAEITGAPA